MAGCQDRMPISSPEDGECSEDDQHDQHDASNSVGIDVESVNGGSEWGTDAKVNWIEIRLRQVEERLVDLSHVESRLTELIEQLNAAAPSGLKRDVVTQGEFESMVEDCISKGHQLGCSKIFIRQYLSENYGQVDNRYVRRRLSMLLKKKVDNGIYRLSNNLYTKA